MKLRILAVAVAVSLLPVASFAADPPAPSADRAKSGKRDGEGRKKYLDDKHKKIEIGRASCRERV